MPPLKGLFNRLFKNPDSTDVRLLEVFTDDEGTMDYVRTLNLGLNLVVSNRDGSFSPEAALSWHGRSEEYPACSGAADCLDQRVGALGR